MKKLLTNEEQRFLSKFAAKQYDGAEDNLFKWNICIGFRIKRRVKIK